MPCMSRDLSKRPVSPCSCVLGCRVTARHGGCPAGRPSRPVCARGRPGVVALCVVSTLRRRAPGSKATRSEVMTQHVAGLRA